MAYRKLFCPREGGGKVTSERLGGVSSIAGVLSEGGRKVTSERVGSSTFETSQ